MCRVRWDLLAERETVVHRENQALLDPWDRVDDREPRAQEDVLEGTASLASPVFVDRREISEPLVYLVCQDIEVTGVTMVLPVTREPPENEA